VRARTARSESISGNARAAADNGMRAYSRTANEYRNSRDGNAAMVKAGCAKCNSLVMENVNVPFLKRALNEELTADSQRLAEIHPSQG
jgi:hypothetical protein